ncbi:c-type cytochrome [Acidimangrovimonas pyrenivorans]|uniref:C-type cytochrome n=1 Tax=Acidimangrovimonas pyrenivorans TaxID=2030798 RepID=A0ABV7AF16_9RHOB
MKRLQLLSAVSIAAALALAAPVGAQQSGNMQGQGMMGPGLFMPRMDPVAGRHLFASKGCVVCHSINGVGGTDAPKLDASTMKMPMDPFDFAAKMWHGAPAMIAMQNSELGAQIQFTGQELADIIAFVHSPAEQKKFSEADIPENIKKHMEEDN